MERLNKHFPHTLSLSNATKKRILFTQLSPHLYLLISSVLTSLLAFSLPLLMGNYISYRQSDTTGKVILSDGTVHKYDNPLTVAELMLEYPQQVVVEFQSAVSGKRPSPLPADKKLEMDKVYIMLPVKRGKPAALSSEASRQLLLRASSVLKSRSLLSSSAYLPLFARICPAGTGLENEFVLHRTKDSVERSEEAAKPEFFPENFELERPEYLSRQLSGKGWKPSLDTIKEKGVNRKVRHWLF